MFDLDGTLIDSVPLFVALINGMLEDRGAAERVTELDARPHATAGGLAMVQALLGSSCGVPEYDLAEFRRRYAALSTPADCLYPYARETLTRLAADKVALAVWSNKSQALCDKVLTDLGLADLLSAIVGTSGGVPLKPDTTGLDRALALAGSDRSHACFIGDSDLDHEAARRASVPFILVTHGYGDYDRSYEGAVVVDGLRGLPAEITRLIARLNA